MKKIISTLLAIMMLFYVIPMTEITAFAVKIGDFDYEILDDGTAEIYAYFGSATDLDIPSEMVIRGYSYTVTRIGVGAFRSCASLKSITIPNSVTSIGDYAFSGCEGLESITIPDSVPSIGDSAFKNCTNLESITIPNSVTSIGDWAFESCTSLKSITIPNSMTSIGFSAFKSCTNLESITIPNSVTMIRESTFESCTSLKSVTIGDGVTSIGHWACAYCTNLKSITLPDSVTDIGQYAFADSSFESITIPKSVTSIGFGAFDNSDLTTIYGYSGSYAETYANGCGYTFIPIQDFADFDSGFLIVVTNADTLPENVELNVKTVETTDSKVGYDITLTADSVVIQPNGTVTVKIPVPETMDGESVKVYREEADGTLTDMNAVYQDGYMVFTTDHFSIYVLTTENLNGLLGDVDGNGEIDDWDSVLLDRYLAGWDVGVDTLAADIDKNGEVDDWDSVLLARKLAGWDNQ